MIDLNRIRPARIPLRALSLLAFAAFMSVLNADEILCLAGSGDSTNQIALSQPLTVKWRYDSDQTTDLTPATDGNRVYLPLIGGSIVCLNANNGQLHWKSDEGGAISASPAVDERSVYVATQPENTIDAQYRGALRALSKETGVTIWMRTLQAPLRGGLVAGSEAIFGGATDGRVQAFDKRTGRTLWAYQYSSPFSSQPQLSGDRLYLGAEDGMLLAVDQKSGQVAWRYRTHGPVRGFRPSRKSKAVCWSPRWIISFIFFPSTAAIICGASNCRDALRRNLPRPATERCSRRFQVTVPLCWG